MTNKELSQISDFAFAAYMLQRRLDAIDNPNTALAGKLRSAISHLKEMDIKKESHFIGHWFIQYYDSNGERISPDDITDRELDRIGELVQTGTCIGEIKEVMGGTIDV